MLYLIDISKNLIQLFQITYDVKMPDNKKKKRINELIDFFNSHLGNSLKQKAAKHGKLIARKMLFVEHMFPYPVDESGH